MWLGIIGGCMFLFDCMNNMGFIFRILAKLVYYIRIIIPIILIVLIAFDLVKVVTGAADDKAKKEAANKAVKRLIYAIIVFLVPSIITLVFRKIGELSPKDSNGTPSTWIGCWNYYYNEVNK